MTQTATKQQPEAAPQPVMGEVSLPEAPLADPREWQAERLRLLWKRRRFFLRAGTLGLIASTVVAFLIPKSYTSTTQLMPPDPQTVGLYLTAQASGSAAGRAPGDKKSVATIERRLSSLSNQAVV